MSNNEKIGVETVRKIVLNFDDREYANFIFILSTFKEVSDELADNLEAQFLAESLLRTLTRS